MSSNAAILLGLAILAANLPFFSERVFFVLAPRDSGHKSIGWRLVELFVLYFVVGGLAHLLEAQVGPVANQKWEFYVVTACLFVVFGYPGFVYRYLWRRRVN